MVKIKRLEIKAEVEEEVESGQTWMIVQNRGCEAVSIEVAAYGVVPCGDLERHKTRTQTKDPARTIPITEGEGG